MENDKRSENSRVSDWQVTVSRGLEMVNIKKMTIDMSKTRLKPVFLSSGDLVIIIPATSEQAAREKGLSIAQRIASDGTWGIDLLDFTNSNLD
jgi:hypothetical protein